MNNRPKLNKKTPKLTRFDRDVCRLLKAELETMLKALEEKFGVKAEVGRMGFSDTSVKIPIEVSVIGEGGIALDRNAQSFKTLATLYGLQADDLGREFRVRGEAFRITGLNTRSDKMPVQGVRVRDGVGFKFPVKFILAVLGRPARAGSLVVGDF